MPSPGNLAITKIIVKALITATTVMTADIVSLVIFHHTNNDTDTKVHEQRIRDQSSRPVR